jgi:hypothetical protein
VLTPITNPKTDDEKLAFGKTNNGEFNNIADIYHFRVRNRNRFANSCDAYLGID